MEEVTNEYLKYLKGQGYTTNNRTTIKSLLLTIISIYVLFEIFCSLITKWENTDRRFAALEDITITGSSCALRIYMFLYTKDLYKVFISFKRPYYLYGIESIDKTQAILKFNQTIRLHNKILKYVMQMIITNLILLPFLQMFYKIVIKSESLTSDNIILPFEVSYITPNYLVIISILLFQVYISTLVIGSGRILYFPLSSAVHRMSLDIELLSISFQDIDEFLDQFDDKERESKCKSYILHLAKHHVDICMQLKFYNEQLRFSSFDVVVISCLYLVVLFYWFIEVDDTLIMRLKDGSQIILVLCYLYGYSLLGQRVINEFDSLPSVMYGCNWIDKPLSFKKTLLMMMTMSTRKFELKPYGLYRVGLTNVTSVLKATYSYCNVLRQTN